MAKLKAAARATNVLPPAKLESDIAADLDGLAAAAASAAASSTCGADATTTAAAQGRRRQPMVVIGHRGKGMNTLASPDPRLRGDVRENTLRAFNDAANSHPAVAYVEFDVQVTKDGCPVIFHDNFIYTQQDGEILGKRVTYLDLDEFLSYGPQREQGKASKPLFRKLKDGRILKWDVRSEDALCTLREVFHGVRRVGFNVELQFDDDLVYTEERLTSILQAVLKVVFEHADDRPIIFSSFQPDAARLIHKLQDKYPVFFLTNGGTQVYADPRRNSLEEAIKLCVAGGLQGIVSELGGPGDTQAAVGGGQDQGGQQAVADNLRPAQQRAGGCVRAAPDGGGRRHRRPGAGDRRRRVGVHGHGRAGVGLPGRRRRHRGGREDRGDSRGGARDVSAASLLLFMNKASKTAVGRTASTLGHSSPVRETRPRKPNTKYAGTEWEK